MRTGEFLEAEWEGCAKLQKKRAKEGIECGYGSMRELLEGAGEEEKIEAKIGEKYMPKGKKVQEEVAPQKGEKVEKRHEIWSEEEVATLPVSLNDPRRQP